MAVRGWGLRFTGQIRGSWVPVALVSGGAALVFSVVQGPAVNVLMLAASVLGLGVSTRTDVFHRLAALPGARTVALTAAWAASALLYLVALGPSAVMAGPGGWSSVGLGLFLQTVYLSAGVGFRRAPVWGAVAVTALTVAALTGVGTVWIGMNYAAAIGAQPPAWTDLLLWWSLAVLVPAVALTSAWLTLGRKIPVDPNPAPDSSLPSS